jgi:hypothetical protein
VELDEGRVWGYRNPDGDWTMEYLRRGHPPVVGVGETREDAVDRIAELVLAS